MTLPSKPPVRLVEPLVIKVLNLNLRAQRIELLTGIKTNVICRYGISTSQNGSKEITA